MTGAEGSALGDASCRQVVAALGPADPDVVRRLLAAAPELTSVVDLPHARVWSGRGLTPWRSGDRQGWTWSSPAPEVTPTGWESAARDAMAPGVELGPDRGVVVHADGMALQDVYAREIGATTYVSTRIGPLLALGGQVTPDLAAWAAILTVGAPAGGSTTVREVRRLSPGEGRCVDAEGHVSRLDARPIWEDLPERAPEPAEMTELLTAAVPPGDGPVVVTLSGGWDSRVLARLALRRGHQVEAWTTYQYHPREKDVVWAQRVAAALGVPQRMVVPHGRDWAAHQAAARRRTDFQTWMHTWLYALSEELRHQPLPVIDGGFGDVLLRANIAARAVQAQGDPVRAFFDGTGGKRLLFVAPELAPALEEAALSELGEVARRLGDHPNRVTLLQLLTRTSRAITAAPRLLVGPDTRVLMPFSHPDVVRGALAVPLAAKDRNAYYRELLTTACDAEGTLRSSNHPGARAQKVENSFLPPSLVRGLIETVRASERATALLGPWLRDSLTDPGAPAELRRRLRPVDVLAWAALLADFEQEYAGRLDWSGWPG